MITFHGRVYSILPPVSMDTRASNSFPGGHVKVKEVDTLTTAFGDNDGLKEQRDIRLCLSVCEG